MLDFKQLPPLALYIHIPWCIKKCPYCDFNSHVSATGLPESEYIAALIKDLDYELPAIWGRNIVSIFIGGGTPSLFSPASIDQLLSALRARLMLKPNIEITLEANPGAIEYGRFQELHDCGINRLSIGVQSFNPEHLTSLGRIHNATEAIKAIETAQEANFDSINVDLMYGLPQQSLQQAEADLQTAIALQPQHISHYQLTIEPNTAFHNRPPVLPTDDRIWQMQQHCQNVLAAAGYAHYEVSAYAQAGHQCLHNLNYWQFGDYLGIGAGAHQKISSAQTQSIQRRWKQRIPQQYLQALTSGPAIDDESTLKTQDIIFEFMLNALRLSDGFEPQLFYQHTGLAISSISPILEKAQQQNLLEWTINKIRPTEKGQRFLNDLLLLFME